MFPSLLVNNFLCPVCRKNFFHVGYNYLYWLTDTPKSLHKWIIEVKLD